MAFSPTIKCIYVSNRPLQKRKGSDNYILLRCCWAFGFQCS